jgi:hypothetical protein
VPVYGYPSSIAGLIRQQDGVPKMPSTKEMLWTVGLTVIGLVVFEKFVRGRI